jgi:hypothetical protein
MKMNNLFTLILTGLIFLVACQSSQVEPSVDCAVEGPTIQVESTLSACDEPNGTVTATVTGGTGPYTFSINANSVSDNSTGIFEGLSAGNYTVSVFDGNDCTAQSNVTVLAADGPEINSTSQEPAGCETSNGSLTVEAVGGTGALSYSLNGGAPQSNPTFNGLAAGSYDLVVSDESGCETIEVVDVLTGVSLNEDIVSIITANCAVSGCHDGSRSPDLRMTSGIIGSAGRIRSRTSARTMPPSNRTPLTQTQIDLISCWVNDGAPDN